MRILIISQFYGSDPEGFFVEDLADHWAGGGHEVLVVTGGVSRDAAASRARVVGGVGRGYDRASLASRFVSISAFAAAAAWAASRESAKRRADVLVSVGTRVPVLPRPRAVIRWTLDRRLQVLAAIATPESIRRTLLHVASVAERLVGELAPSVEVAISAEMAATASRRGRRVEHIPLWAPQNVTHRRDRSSERRRREGLAEGQFLLRYQGNLGRAYDFATLLDAARQLRGTAVRVVVAGRGSERAFLERSLATDAELRSVVSLLDAVAPDELPHALAAADAHLVPLRPGTGGATFPSKLVSALATGRPVIVTGGGAGEIARLVRGSGCGIAVEASGDELARAVRSLAADRKGCERMGEAARELYERAFSRERAFAAWDELLASLG